MIIVGVYQAVVSDMLCGNSIMLNGYGHVCFFDLNCQVKCNDVE